MGRRRTSTSAICLLCTLGSLAIWWRETPLSAAPVAASRSVFRSSGGITQTYVIDYSLAGRSPRDSSRQPHIARLFATLRARQPRAVAGYVRILDSRHTMTFEMAFTRVVGSAWKGAPVYDLAVMESSGADRQLRAVWLKDSVGGFGLDALSPSLHPNANAIIRARLGHAPGTSTMILYLIFRSSDGRHLMVAARDTQTPLQSALSLLLQARLLLAPVPPAPTATPTPTPRATPTPTPVPTATTVAATVTSVSQNAPTPLRAAIVHAFHGTWNPPSVSVGVNASVTWENDDSGSAYAVECVQALSSAPCPWAVPLALPAASGGNMPTASITFVRPGIFVFRDTVHTSMQGEVVVGAPGHP